MARIRDEIRRDGPITFARFMELALHDPAHGYYAAGPVRLGTEGDFLTASDLGPAFGRAVAQQVVELDRCLNSPPRLDLIEFGAGRGLLARDLLEALRTSTQEIHARVGYTAVDASAGMRREIARVAPDVVLGPPPAAATGCILALELFDALPVHRIRRSGGLLEEIGVGWDGERFVEATIAPSPELRRFAERYGAAAAEGFEAEVALGFGREVDRWDRAIESGFALVLDYGDTAERLYAVERKRGTLMAYRAHRTTTAYLERVGEQDLTAHVNFTALTDAAEKRGWRLLGRTTQDRFLIANGILDEFEKMDDGAYRDPQRIRARQSIKQLIHPTGMGRMFQVWIYGKGLDGTPELAGLADPFAR
ncbi:MAG: SAM-dependent methyltransferase [Acidobacteria bacterium]|nr:SAM-dependent methyltransferase [Acidobacteriota bacterium]NIO59194.1 SAM-dependent methyltransferase [Acidobacteriota bacterium]NIQ30221.1 SAM-dependent methyltransferase [Acidobacteriota bacterium]